MAQNKPNKCLVVLGPTSSGKSDVAVRLARQFNGEIISADSRQIYIDLNLGTGKVPGAWQLVDDKKIFVFDDIPHHLIDFVLPTDEYNIAHFQKDCRALINDIHARGKLPIICGGTGFWISAVVDNIVLPEVKPNPQLREELESYSLQALFDLLKRVDPGRAKTVDQKNKVRLIRAIEIAQAIGKVPKIAVPLSQRSTLVDRVKQHFQPPTPTSYQLPATSYIQIGIDHPKTILEERIRQRLEQRFAAGMVEEVTMLKNTYPLSWKKIQSFGLGYYWIPLFLQHLLTEQEMKERVLIAERQYAKRQRTWFKRDKRIQWIADYHDIELAISEFLG